MGDQWMHTTWIPHPNSRNFRSILCIDPIASADPRNKSRSNPDRVLRMAFRCRSINSCMTAPLLSTPLAPRPTAYSTQRLGCGQRRPSARPPANGWHPFRQYREGFPGSACRKRASTFPAPFSPARDVTFGGCVLRGRGSGWPDETRFSGGGVCEWLGGGSLGFGVGCLALGGEGFVSPRRGVVGRWFGRSCGGSTRGGGFQEGSEGGEEAGESALDVLTFELFEEAEGGLQNFGAEGETLAFGQLLGGAADKLDE